MMRAYVVAIGALLVLLASSGIASAEEEAAVTEETGGEAAVSVSEGEAPAATPAEAPAAAPVEAPAEAPQAAPQTAPQTAPQAAPQTAPQAAPQGAPAAAAARVPERVARLGRVETILIENDDPESALEFGEEALREGGDDAALRLLIGACLMRLDRQADAVPHFDSAASLSASGDPVLHMHALYSLGRALTVLEGREADAAAAYERYVAHVRAHQELGGFAEAAEARAATLRNRAEAASSPPPRRRRR